MDTTDRQLTPEPGQTMAASSRCLHCDWNRRPETMKSNNTINLTIAATVLLGFIAGVGGVGEAERITNHLYSCKCVSNAYVVCEWWRQRVTGYIGSSNEGYQCFGFKYSLCRYRPISMHHVTLLVYMSVYRIVVDMFCVCKVNGAPCFTKGFHLVLQWLYIDVTSDLAAQHTSVAVSAAKLYINKCVIPADSLPHF